MIFVYTTCKDMAEAKALGQKIFETKAAACVDMWPVESMYYWEGKLQNITQAMLLVTTLEGKLQDVDDIISANHSYSVPLIAGVDIRRINHEYKEWMVQTIHS